MAACRRVYDSRHLQVDCQEPVSAPEPYDRPSYATYVCVCVCVLGCRAGCYSQVTGLAWAYPTSCSSLLTASLIIRRCRGPKRSRLAAKASASSPLVAAQYTHCTLHCIRTAHKLTHSLSPCWSVRCRGGSPPPAR